MSISSTRGFYSQESFVPGPRLIDGHDFATLFNASQSYAKGIVAHAGGGQALATPLTAALNQIDTCASDNDSVMLPPAIPGLTVTINNNTAHTLAVFGVPDNVNNGDVGDTIAVQGSTVQAATGTGVTQATGVITTYVCTQLGQWKQGSLS